MWELSWMLLFYPQRDILMRTVEAGCKRPRWRFSYRRQNTNAAAQYNLLDLADSMLWKIKSKQIGRVKFRHLWGESLFTYWLQSSRFYLLQFYWHFKHKKQSPNVVKKMKCTCIIFPDLLPVVVQAWANCDLVIKSYKSMGKTSRAPPGTMWYS